MRSAKRVRRTQEKMGFVFIGSDGSHFHYRAPNGRKIAVVLGHKEIWEASLKKTVTLGDVAWTDVEAHY